MADLVIDRCLPSEHEAQIRNLFHRGGRPEFDVVYEQAYKAREPHGLRSWIGRTDVR